MSNPLVLVTGAGGFLGKAVTAELVANGFTVRAMARRGGSVGALEGACEVVQADVTDARSIAKVTSGVGAVVHLAGRAHVMRETVADPLWEFRRVNVDGTRTLLAAAKAAGASRFVFISSVKAVGESTTAPWTSRSLAAPASAYGVSKLEAEALVHRSASAGFRPTILRLPLVYGPGMRGNMLSLFDHVSNRIPLPLGGISNARSIVFSGNVATAIRHVLAMAAPPPGPLFVADAEDFSTPGLVRLIAKSLGEPLRLFAVPAQITGPATQLFSALRTLGLTGPLAALNRVVGSLQVDAKELTEKTGFAPPFSSAEGMRVTADWYSRTRR